MLSGANASADAFAREAEQSNFIYYAGHTTGGDDARLPLRYANGRLIAADDIAQLRLGHTRLVVLAGCGTMQGVGTHLEGVPSLARAFLAAGATSVIGTLWPIDDRPSARAFEALNCHLFAGASPVVALSNAQRELLRDGDPFFRHPATWAAVELLGLP